MKRGVFIVVLMLLMATSALAIENDCVYYFYGDQCDECGITTKYLDTLGKKHTDLQLTKFEVYKHDTNSKALEELFDSRKVPKSERQIPAVFMTNQYFVGKNSITTLLETSIISNSEEGCPGAGNESIGIHGSGEPSNVLDLFTFLAVTKEALKDGFNKTNVALLLLFLVMLGAIKNEDLMVKRGVLFLGVVGAVYFILGLGFVSVKDYEKITFFFYKSIGVIMAIAGLVRIKGFFKTWKMLAGTIPEGMRARARKIKEGLLSTTGVMLIGLVTGIIAAGGTTKTFEILQGSFSANSNRLIVFPMLIYYVFLMIVPFTLLVVAMHLIMDKIESHATKKSEDDEEKLNLWRAHNTKLFNFVVSCILLVVGTILLFV